MFEYDFLTSTIFFLLLVIVITFIEYGFFWQKEVGTFSNFMSQSSNFMFFISNEDLQMLFKKNRNILNFLITVLVKYIIGLLIFKLLKLFQFFLIKHFKIYLSLLFLLIVNNLILNSF